MYDPCTVTCASRRRRPLARPALNWGGQILQYGKRTRIALCEAENSTKEKAAVGLQPRLQAVLGLEALTMGLLILARPPSRPVVS
jgi:hypothetical protein